MRQTSICFVHTYANFFDTHVWHFWHIYVSHFFAYVCRIWLSFWNDLSSAVNHMRIFLSHMCDIECHTYVTTLNACLSHMVVHLTHICAKSHTYVLSILHMFVLLFAHVCHSHLTCQPYANFVVTHVWLLHVTHVCRFWTHGCRVWLYKFHTYVSIIRIWLSHIVTYACTKQMHVCQMSHMCVVNHMLMGLSHMCDFASHTCVTSFHVWLYNCHTYVSRFLHMVATYGYHICLSHIIDAHVWHVWLT